MDEVYTTLPGATFGTWNLVMNSTNPNGLLLAPENSSAPKTKADRFLCWPLMAALSWLVAVVLVRSIPDPWWFVGILAVYLFWGMSALGAAIAALIFIYGRTWRRAVSMAILPAVTLAAYLNGNFVVHIVNLAADDLQLLFTLPTYSREISNLPHQEGPRIATFLWRDLNGFGLAFGYEFLVYDESDEIILPAEQRSAAWKKNGGSDLECKLTGVYHAFGHYYFVGHGVDC